LHHGDQWTVENRGTTDAIGEAILETPHGVVGATLVNQLLGWQVRILTPVTVGATLRLWAKTTLKAEITTAAGEPYPVPSAQILSGPLGCQVAVPFTGERSLSRDGEDRVTLQLNNPVANSLVRLRRQGEMAGDRLKVRVTPASLIAVEREIPEDHATGESIRLFGLLSTADSVVFL